MNPAFKTVDPQGFEMKGFPAEGSTQEAVRRKILNFSGKSIPSPRRLKRNAFRIDPYWIQ